jgi:general secretion pathway protein K
MVLRSYFNRHMTIARSGKSRGFILILSLLTLGVIGALSLSLTLSSRARIKISTNLRWAAEAEAISDGMISLMIMDRYQALQQGQRSHSRLPWNGIPMSCVGPGNSMVTMSADDEGGKIDLNASSAALILRLFVGLGISQIDASNAIERLDEYRRLISQGRGQSIVSIQELSTVFIADPVLVRRLLPHVTVHSRQPGLDETVAKPSTIELLADRDRPGLLPPLFQQPSTSRAFRLTADVTIPSGARFIREALVTFHMDQAQPYVIEEWLRTTKSEKGEIGAISQTAC